MARAGIPRAVDPESVPLPRGDGGQVGVPDVPVDLVEPDPDLGAVLLDQAEFDLLGHLENNESWCRRRRRWRRAGTGCRATP